MLVDLGQVVLKTQHIFQNTSTPLTNLWRKDRGRTGMVVIWHLPSIFIPRPRAHRTHSENGHKIRVFTREAFLLLVLLERTVHKEDSSGAWGQVRSGLLAITRDLSTQPPGTGTCEAHCGWTVIGATWDQSWTEGSWMTFNKIRSQELKKFFEHFYLFKLFTVPSSVFSWRWISLLLTPLLVGTVARQPEHLRPVLGFLKAFWIDKLLQTCTFVIAFCSPCVFPLLVLVMCYVDAEIPSALPCSYWQSLRVSVFHDCWPFLLCPRASHIRMVLCL